MGPVYVHSGPEDLDFDDPVEFGWLCGVLYDALDIVHVEGRVLALFSGRTLKCST